METHHNPFRIVSDNPWADERSYRPDCAELLRESQRQPLLDRISDALGSERLLFAEIGFVLGCFATVGLAFLWAKVL